jgi:hypothetical protein
MYEEGLVARKVLEFNTAMFDPYREWEKAFEWDERHHSGRKKYLRNDGTYLIYLPNNELRVKGFSSLTAFQNVNEFDHVWADILKQPLELIAGQLGIDDPVIVQADVARMPPGGDTILHTDTRYQQRYSRRYNIAVSTNDDCWLYHNSYDLDNGGIRDHISEGEVWELNNKIIHTAVNYGKTWRTHIIIDVMPRDYYFRMLEVCEPFSKVPNPQRLNTTFDYNKDGTLMDQQPLFSDRPHCFPSRTQV